MSQSEDASLSIQGTDSRHVDLHTDCVSTDFWTQIIALTCYELNESIASDAPQERDGKVYFYIVKPLENGKPTLHDLKVKIGHSSLISPFFQCSSGVFDIRWSNRSQEDDSISSIMGLALADGSFRRFKVELPFSSLSAFKEAMAQGNIPEFVTVSDVAEYPCESDRDLALGLDISRIYDDSPSDDESTTTCTNESASSLPTTVSSSEMSAVGYQSGAIAVFDLSGLSLAPIWSCPNAHMAEVWQTQWIYDATFDHQMDTSIHGYNKDSLPTAYGKKLTNLFISGSDDASFKLWDIRSDPTAGAVAVNKRHFQTGVTCFASPWASPCATARTLLPNHILIGSYDASLSLWDLRSITKPINSISLDGGVWRLRWLPTMPLASKNRLDSALIEDASYLGVAAMHAGFKVVRIDRQGISEETQSNVPSNVQMTQVASYWGPHKGSADGKFPPLAYGLDWAVSPGSHRHLLSHPTLASCTFYDNCMSLWQV